MKPGDIKIAEGVFARKDKLFNHRLIYPCKNTDGTINWFNLFTGGSWGNVIGALVISAVMVGLVFAYRHDVAALVECCNRCNEAKDVIVPMINNMVSNISYP